MDVVRKDATIVNTDEAFPGSFEVILSAPTKDRDGETLLPTEWKTPLPARIPFDTDHGMSVSTTVGSGTPYLDADGTLRVKGTYSKLPHAQDVRTLVTEGHVTHTSVAYLSEKTQKDGVSSVTRELLNGAFVNTPSNREAVILASKGLDVKTGRRNSATDQTRLDEIARHAIALGANIATGGDTSANEDVAAGKSFRGMTLKAVANSYEQAQQAISDALSVIYSANGDTWAYPIATFPDKVVYRVSGSGRSGQWQATYTVGDDGTVTLGTPERVNLVEQIIPTKGHARKDSNPDPASMVQQIDAALDQIPELIDGVDLATLPAAVQQALSLAQAAGAVVDELMDVTGIPDPDDEDDSGVETASAAAAPTKGATATDTKSAPVEADSIDQQVMAARQRYYSTLSERN